MKSVWGYSKNPVNPSFYSLWIEAECFDHHLKVLLFLVLHEIEILNSRIFWIPWTRTTLAKSSKFNFQYKWSQRPKRNTFNSFVTQSTKASHFSIFVTWVFTVIWVLSRGTVLSKTPVSLLLIILYHTFLLLLRCFLRMLTLQPKYAIFQFFLPFLQISDLLLWIKVSATCINVV